MKKLLDYWKHGRHAAIRGFETPPSYNKKVGLDDRFRGSSYPLRVKRVCLSL